MAHTDTWDSFIAKLDNSILGRKQIRLSAPEIRQPVPNKAMADFSASREISKIRNQKG